MTLSQKSLANAIRALSIDAVNLANSGHPGMPMGMADIAEVLWNHHLNHNPANPNWFNRDRFVLSNGHGSMLLYALLHLSGYDLSIDDIKAFRQLNSKTPGHPEFGHTPGVETTTGPLGQGLAMAVGLAIAESRLAADFNQPNIPLIDHYTYAFAGDGCLMEGISHEACSLAGTLNLGKLIVFYDSNGISIDGKIDNWFSDDTAGRFIAYGWQVIEEIDGHDANAINDAILKAKANQSKPTLIICKTTIGYGSPSLAGSEKSHGAPLGEDEGQKTKAALNWPHPAFHIPKDIKKAWCHKAKGQQKEAAWQELFTHYQQSYPQLAKRFLRQTTNTLPENFIKDYQALTLNHPGLKKPLASRKASQFCLDSLHQLLPELMGGSADLTGSNNTLAENVKAYLPSNPSGQYLYYGVREFGMSAILNGLALHGGIIPFAGTFLVFSDYAKNAIRLSALMNQKVIYVFSHDSIGLGEDGPTHQPIEHLSALRSMPNLTVWRPADNMETAIAWQEAIRHQGPSTLILSRQTLSPLHQNLDRADEIAKGAYILCQTNDTPDLILLSTGSEVSLALLAKEALENEAISVRIVSMPSIETFLRQEKSYQESILPKRIKARIAIEASHKDYWYKFVGLDGDIIGLSDFGLSAPGKAIYQHFDITPEAITHSAKKLLASFKVGVNV